MNDTLESIQPINNLASNSDLSFIYGRDPSILAYGQQPFPIEKTKKDLESLYEDEVQATRSDISSLPSISTLADTIKVYLRLRPFPRNMKVSQQQQDAYKIINANTLLTKLPSLDNNTSSLKRLRASETILRKFTFSDTFGPETTQLQLFEQAVKQQMNDFLNGRSATVMSYGTTNAGKSYTLQGTTLSPGIIPRGLEYVFCNIHPKPIPCYKPVHNTDVTSLDASASAHEIELKTKLIAFSSLDKNKCIQAYRSMQQLLRDESPMQLSKTSDAKYSVWVSFAEIYNETIFDLLSNDCQKKRPSLKLATDNNGKAFIKNLKMVCVNSSSEAYQLLMVGQDNLKIAATALNTRSSRSHCIFTIKLLKYYEENKPNDVEVSTFSFCDLAGSERLKKTLNAGERLKEAQNINTSLLVLGRCLKSIFDVQSAKSKHEVTGPFRESKLTRLFQPALSGKEHIALIVNVNPVPNLYNETQNVLNFSAIAKQIIVQPVAYKKKAPNSRFSQIVSQSVTTVTDWDAIDLESIGEEPSSRATERVEYVHVEDYEEVVQLNEKLKKEIAQLKTAALNKDFEIRQEMSNIYTAMIDNLEANFKNRLRDAEEQQEDMLAWSVKHVEDYYKEKLSTLSSRKRSRIDTGDDSDGEIDIAELEAENVELTAKVETLKKSVKELREAKEELLIKNNQNVFELSLVKKDLQNCRNLLHAAQNDIGCGDQAEKVIEELKTQLLARDEQIKSLKVYLNEAKEEFIRITKVEAELENCMKSKDEQLVESSEKINDLMQQFENTNLCLAEYTKTVEDLEEKLDLYANNLAAAEENLQNSEDKLNKSAANYLVILKENEELKKFIGEEISRSKIAANKCNCEEQVTELEELKKELSQVTVEAEEFKVQIKTKDEAIDTLNSKIEECEKIAERLRGDLEESLNKNRENSEVSEENWKNIATLEEHLSKTLENFGEISTKRLIEHENRIKKFEKDVSAAKERDLIKDQLLDAHTQTISQLKKDITEAENLREKLTVFDNKLKICEEEKAKLEKRLDENSEKILSLENELQASRIREQDKENETISLQKEIKSMIQMSVNESKRDIEMEKEVKKTLRELTAAQKALADSEAAFEVREKASAEKILLLEMEVKTFEKNASYLAMLQECAEKTQAESEQLRKSNERLRQEIEQKNQELVSFNKNRDDTIQRYETLVKQLQEEVERTKREVSRYQELFLRQSTPTPRKEEIRKLRDELSHKSSLLEQVQAKLKKSQSMREETDNINTSDDESLPTNTCRSRRRGKNVASVLANNDESIIELSGSESKRVTRRTALPPPATVPSVEKRKPRKKKLFASTEDTCVDIEPTEMTTPRSIVRSPLAAMRSLRNRRK